MNILITGGAGFIGSHLCKKLIEQGNSIICIDNFITGSIDNVKELTKEPNFKLIEHDISNPLYIDESLDWVLHLASIASPKYYLGYPIKTLKSGLLGTHNCLGLAKDKKAKFLLASTSEVYGDPLVHPQTEEYWGNVNTIGPRSCYDESKRAAESLTYAYMRQHNVDVRVVRIFNSILENELVVVFNDKEMHWESIGKYVRRLQNKKIITLDREILVPSLDFSDYKIKLKRVNTLIKHRYEGDAYELSLAYGRKVKVTGDHSIFKRSSCGKAIPVPVREIKKGDFVAIAKNLPVLEKDFTLIDIYLSLVRNVKDIAELWDYAIFNIEEKIIEKNKEEILQILKESQRFKAKRERNNYLCMYKQYRKRSFLPAYILYRLNGLNVNLEKAKVRIAKAGAHIYTPNNIIVDEDILWFIGLFIAEGSSHYKENKSIFITLSSEEKFLLRAKLILENKFGAHVIFRKYEKGKRAPSLFIHSKVLYFILDKIFNILHIYKKGLPLWIMQLPLHKLKYILEGFKDGDGTHSGKKVGNELCFDTSSKMLAFSLNMVLLRFGIVASLGKYYTYFKKKYGSRRFPFYRLTICNLSTFNILEWDKGVCQKLLAREEGDLVWAWVKEVKRCKGTTYVYDFSVPGSENFIAGNGVYCHNTYGPKMQIDDGRVVSNFIVQALKNDNLTVFGQGSQTRSFCYIDDLIKGILQIMNVDYKLPLNLGNPSEFKIIELAKAVLKLTNAKSKIEFLPLPEDDPQKRCPDISKVKKMLNWKPEISLEAGLEKTIDYFKKKLDNF